MKILVACEFSGVVRNAFRSRGHDAWSCDLLPAEDGSSFHIQGDALEAANGGWDLMIAHPPCTRLTNSGVRWLHKPPEFMDMVERMSPGPYLELFARSGRTGWDSWGNEYRTKDFPVLDAAVKVANL